MTNLEAEVEVSEIQRKIWEFESALAVLEVLGWRGIGNESGNDIWENYKGKVVRIGSELESENGQMSNEERKKYSGLISKYQILINSLGV